MFLQKKITLLNYKPENNKFNAVFKYILPFLLSILFIWLVGFFFCNSLRPFQYDDSLGKYIHIPGTVYRQRSEGFAATHKGLFGVNGIADISKISKKKIVVWGDSYVEAHQVGDKQKIPQIITEKLDQRGLGGQLICFGVGMSGDSVADYYFEIPKYESAIEGIVAHYIVITGLGDILPDQATDNKKGIFTSNPLLLSEDNWKPRFQKIKNLFYKLQLSFIWKPLISFPATIAQLRFMPGKQSRKVNNEINEKSGDVYSDQFLIKSWNYLLGKLKVQTEHPLVFVYAPTVPEIRNGKVLTASPKNESIELFIKIAGTYDVQVLNATESFVSFYEDTGLFPRGFANTEPAEGHFNRYGHAIVASIIVDHFVNKKNKQ